MLISKPGTIARVFTSDPDTIAVIKETLPMVAIYNIFSGIQGVQSGNVRALGQQQAASLTAMVCYYFFGLPLAIYLGFNKNLELFGFWLGFTIALLFLDSIVATVVIRSDWSSKDIQDAELNSDWSM